MADIAIGKPCPRDGTLTACAGAFTDTELFGQCAVCKQNVSVPNPVYSPGYQGAIENDVADDVVIRDRDDDIPDDFDKADGSDDIPDDGGELVHA